MRCLKLETKASVPIKLDGTFNTRELGGYKTADNQTTLENRILRSDGLQNLSNDDKEFLYSYGVRMIIDMRSRGEVSSARCAMEGYRDVKYINIPLLDHIHSENDKFNFPASLREMYTDLFENSKELIADILRVILDTKDGCLLYNCTAGKDRTGIISAIMLMVSGISLETVVTDYAATAEYIKEFTIKRIEFFNKLNVSIPDYLFTSPKDEMEFAINLLSEKYGDIYKYLNNIGLSESEISGLKSKLLCNAHKPDGRNEHPPYI